LSVTSYVDQRLKLREASMRMHIKGLSHNSAQKFNMLKTVVVE